MRLIKIFLGLMFFPYGVYLVYEYFSSGKFFKNTFQKSLEEKLNSDEKLQKQIKEGDEQIEKIKADILEMMLKGIEVPKYGRKYVNLNSFTNEEIESLDKKIIENITNGFCPNDELMKISSFDDSHKLWGQYETLKIKKERENELRLKKLNSRKKEEEKAEQKRIEGLISKFGKENYDKAINGELFENMDEELLIISKGIPPKKDNNLVKGKKTEIWYYDEYENRLKNLSYKLSVRLVDGKVKGWKNI